MRGHGRPRRALQPAPCTLHGCPALLPALPVSASSRPGSRKQGPRPPRRARPPPPPTLLRMRLCRFSVLSRRVMTRASTVNRWGRPAGRWRTGRLSRLPRARRGPRIHHRPARGASPLRVRAAAGCMVGAERLLWAASPVKLGRVLRAAILAAPRSQGFVASRASGREGGRRPSSTAHEASWAGRRWRCACASRGARSTQLAGMHAGQRRGARPATLRSPSQAGLKAVLQRAAVSQRCGATMGACKPISRRNARALPTARRPCRRCRARPRRKPTPPMPIHPAWGLPVHVAVLAVEWRKACLRVRHWCLLLPPPRPTMLPPASKALRSQRLLALKGGLVGIKYGSSKCGGQPMCSNSGTKGDTQKGWRAFRVGAGRDGPYVQLGVS